MPPRPRICSYCLHPHPVSTLPPLGLSRYASTATASLITPAPTLHQPPFAPPIVRHSHNQPPSHRAPEDRRSQLHRQYTSLLRSTPLLIFFQHNNLKATEWMSVRRELAQAMRKADAAATAQLHNPPPPLADSIKMQIITTNLFQAALLVVEHFRPSEHNPTTLTHALSRTAHTAVASQKATHSLRPLLAGPLAVVSFPTLSPTHIKAALSILAPQSPNFAAPTRRANPGYHDATTQTGLQKLLLLGARVGGGETLDAEGVRWMAGIEGGLDGIRAQLVSVLAGVGAGVTLALDTPGRSLYFAVEGRRGMLEEQEKEGGGA